MNIPLFDAHCDTISRIANYPGRSFTRNTDQWNLDRLEEVKEKAQIFALFWDSAISGGSAAVEYQLRVFQKLCKDEENRIAHCRNGEEADEAIRQGKLAAFLSVEGGELLDCSLERLRWAYDQGVRIVNLTWNYANALSGSHNDDFDRGLSEQGRSFVMEMERLGMLPDVSHLSDAGFWDVVELTKKPIIASHSNSRDVFFHTRNLTDAQFTAIIKNHGVVGLNCYSRFLGEGKVTMNTLQKHLDHFLALGGEKTVALGGDWDGCDKLPSGWDGVWNWLDFYEHLWKQNYPEQLLRDLYFNNLMRTVIEVCTI